MCAGPFAPPKIPTPPPVTAPTPVPAPPAPEPTPDAPTTSASGQTQKQAGTTIAANRNGTNSLIIPLNIPLGGVIPGNGLSIPRG